MKPLLTYTLAASALGQVTVPIEPDFAPVRWGDWAAVGDPLRPQQWGLDAIGGDLPPPQRRLPLVAINDTGVANWHEDVPPGRFYLTIGDDPIDDHGHGTHVAGIVNAMTNNGLGIAGIMNSDVLPEVVSVKCLLHGGGSVASVAAGIIVGVTAGAEVVNCSLQGPDGPWMRWAAAWAEATGAIIVFAAGNSWGGPVSGLASDPYHIVVSSIDENLQISEFSSVGKRVDFCAPGGEVLSCYPFDGRFSREPVSEYIKLSGTSMAAPHVAGTIARMRGQRFLTRDQAYKALQYTAIDLGEPGWDPLYGWGLIQAPAAVDLVRRDRADFNRDGQKTVADFIAFQDAMVAGEFTADFDLDGALTFIDFLVFTQEFAP